MKAKRGKRAAKEKSGKREEKEEEQNPNVGK